MKAELGGYKLKKITGPPGLTNGKLTIKTKVGSQTQSDLNDLTQGRAFGELKMTKDDFLNFGLTINGLNFLHSKDFWVTIKSKPSYQTTIDLTFEDNFELTDVPIQIYASKYLVECFLNYKGNIIKATTVANVTENISFTKANIGLTFSPSHEYLRVKDGLKIYQFLQRITSGEKCDVTLASGSIVDIQLSEMKDLNSEISEALSYFEKLSEIEKYYKVTFNKLLITDEAVDITNKIYSLVTNQNLIIEFIEKFIKIENLAKQQPAELVNFRGPIFIFQSTEPEEVELYGKKLHLGYLQLKVYEPIIDIVDSVPTEEIKLRIKSKINKAEIRYLKDLPSS